jgi:hypothetical protein
MKNLLFTSIALLVASVVASSAPVANADDHHKKLKDSLGWLIGDWEAKWEEDGRKLESSDSFKWVLDGAYLQWNPTVNVDGKVDFKGIGLIWWDDEAQKLKGQLFENSREQGVGSSFGISSDASGGKLVWHVYDKEGGKKVLVRSWTRIDADKIIDKFDWVDPSRQDTESTWKRNR